MDLIEAVPNFSVARQSFKVAALASALDADGAHLLDVDSGLDANRTVYTLVGSPEPVVRALLRALEVAEAQLDMASHQGNHPCVGALDVCPLVPLGATPLSKVIPWAHWLGEQLARRFELPVYLYGPLGRDANHRELSFLRRGGFSGLQVRMNGDLGPPDYGPAQPHARLGATLVTARPLMLAYNVNLPGADLAGAQEVARLLRRQRLEDKALASARFLGWTLTERALAQVSTNLLDYRQFSLKQAYEAVRETAASLGLKVQGSELIGLCPLEALVPLADLGLIGQAAYDLGLDAFGPFDKDRKIIELNLLKKGLIREVQSLGQHLPDQ